jgi:hypothetical protein
MVWWYDGEVVWWFVDAVVDGVAVVRMEVQHEQLQMRIRNDVDIW